MSNVFAKIAPYGYIHHRALNDRKHFAAAESFLAAFPAAHQILEGDVCWDFENGRQDFYFRHPTLVWDTLPARAVSKGQTAGGLVTLEDMLERDSVDRRYVIELKVGRGDVRAAMRRLVEILQATCRDRFWIDGFSLKLARLVKSIDASVLTSLHTERVTEQHVWIAAPDQWITRAKLEELSGVDAIAIRKRHSEAYMARASAAVLKHGFKLIVSRLFTLHDYELSRNWGAVAGYPKVAFPEVMRFNTAHGLD